eukprot:12448807-Ditylum_brightwellii.AAC.1
MLRGMITQSLHVLLKDMPTPLIIGNDAGNNKMINMLRVVLTYPAPINDKGSSIISEEMRYKTLYSLHNTNIEVNN